MRQLSCNAVLSTTLLSLWVFFKVSCGQSDCEQCEFETNVSTTEISVSFCDYYNEISHFASGPRAFTIELNCTDILPDAGKENSSMFHTFPGLTPGNKYTINIVIDENETKTKIVYTRPGAIGNLSVTNVTSSSVHLYWTKPQGEASFYRVEWEYDSITSNTTSNEAYISLPGLNAGTQYTFRVIPVAGDGRTEGLATERLHYTKPEKVSATVSNKRTNDSIEVTWTSPPGLVGKYRADLSSRYEDDQSMLLDPNFHTHTFRGLNAGRNYTVVVTTISGPFAEPSEPVTEATYPNAPGAIYTERQTTDSIAISWGQPQGMDFGQYKFIILYPPHINGRAETSNNRIVLESLTSGTLYDISVVAEGPMAYQSTEVTAEIYTRPHPVLGLIATTINTTVVVLQWHRPEVYQEGYSYRVETSGCTPAPRNQTELDSQAIIIGLTPGTNCCFSVYSLARNGIEGEPVSVCQYTRPHPVLGLNATTISTTVVVLQWHRPEGYLEGYRVETSGCTSAPRNQTELDSQAIIIGLTPGTNCCFSVYSLARNGIEGEPVSVCQYTKPERATITVSNNCTKDSIEVTWTPPSGNVEEYKVKLTSSYGDNKAVDLDSSSRAYSFSGLNAGRNYTVVVTTISGPFAEPSEPVTEATYPNAPGAIHTEWQTTDSIAISWGQPQGMDFGQYKFIIFYPPHINGRAETSNNSIVLESLTSGTLYDISVVTEGPMAYQSTEVTAEIYTRPHPVLGLNATMISTTEVVLQWHRPEGYLEGYRVETSGCTSAPRNQIEQDSQAIITGLTPGTNCSFTVYSLARNGIEGEPVSVCQYTKPERVKVKVSSRGTNDSIEVTWTPPSGNVEEYKVKLTSSYGDNQTVDLHSSFRAHPFSGLNAGRNYTVVVTTISGPFAEPSEPVTEATYPNAPGAIYTERQTTDSISISWGQPQGMDLGQYKFIIFYPPHINGRAETSNNRIVLESLTSGTLYDISVVTEGPMAYQSTEVTAEIYTRPHPVLGLNATTISTTEVVLQWHRPEGHLKGYRVETSGCTSAPRNQTELDSQAIIIGLTPGTNCCFTVYSLAQNGIEGEPVSVCQYTKPERVNPTVSNKGTNDSIEVSWMSPLGNVENYNVGLTSSDGDDQTVVLNSSFQSHSFSGLNAGRSYTVIVTTVSGPFAEESEPVSSATYPNTPGPITVTKKTTKSVSIEWIPSPGMNDDSFYRVVYNSSAHDHKSFETDFNTLNIGDLVSGTTYSISVATVGLFNFTSLPVFLSTTTRPESIEDLQVSSTAADMISVRWKPPAGVKPGYSYRVRVLDSTGQLVENDKTLELAYKFTGLVPGNMYRTEVASQTSDWTEGSPMILSVCTDSSPVVTFKCEGPNGVGPWLILTWDSPEGANTGFTLSWSAKDSVALSACEGSCSHTIGELAYHTRYNVSIQTHGCGRSSSVYRAVCQTGITAPPEPNPHIGMEILNKEHDMFVLKFSSSILNGINGPVVAYGILLTSNLKGFSDENSIGLRKYLNKTYDDWKKDTSLPYLTTARETGPGQNRNDQSELEVVVGSGSTWNGYNNGPLTARTTYRFALVMFTHLVIRDELVDTSQSLFSNSPFYANAADLPEDPTVITTGAVAGALSGLLCLTAGAAGLIVYRKRAAKKKSSEIPIQSIRAKVSVAVRVEDYEAYHKKQSADSRCGFAEEYEDLRLVGTAQSKAHAEALENRAKNRYSNVLPYDSTRVKLSIQGSSHDDYINASHVPGFNCKKEFIAAQGPLPGTVDEFWRMLWEKNVHTLVMLTKCNELGRVKCEQYWPAQTKHFKNIAVTTTSEIPLEDWTIRDFDVKNVKTAETRSLRQFHFTAWPDHGVPESTELLLNFRHLVREHMEQFSLNSPTVVHCSAGVGRTGTMIAIDHLILQIERESMADVFGIVYDMRMHRALMVQTEDQYVFLHKCALDFIKSRTGTNVDLIYQNMAAQEIYENVLPMAGGAMAMEP